MRWLLWTIVCSLWTDSICQPAETVDTVDERIFLLKDLEFLIDTTNALTFEQVVDPARAIYFQRYPNYRNKDYQSGASYWIRFRVQHVPTQKIWLIEFYHRSD